MTVVPEAERLAASLEQAASDGDGAHHEALLAALRYALTNGRPTSLPGDPPRSTWRPSYAVWRLLHAWASAAVGSSAQSSWNATVVFGPDLLVLLRQAIRWHGMPLHAGVLHPTVMAGVTRYGDVLGVRVVAGHLEATPFHPTWLDDATNVGPLDAPPVDRRPFEPLPAEPFLTARLGFSSWNSAAQKEGVWRALTAAPRSTSLIALPTGAGKSLCFQALAASATGLVVVVVPTVALAIDHWRSAAQVFPAGSGVTALYYAAGDPSLPADRVIEEVQAGRCRLLFTSPEACVSGKLRPVLAESARAGRLEALVIDEAHLADSWGMFFRVDFQVLAALRRQWLEAPAARLRTLLLSATFTRECRATLRRLFADPDAPWYEVVSQRLRPELTYFTQVFASAQARASAVLECAWHLPRPAILYTTKRTDARAWTARLRNEGFTRVACFDGDTPAAERRALLDRWRANDIDVMVATSAFGMGVDKPDVRTIIHACLPEDLHRFYQEVGRGGRDGASATSVLLPLFPGDRDVAEGLAPRLLKPETLARRWKALWDTHERGDRPNTWRVRTGAAPSNLYAAETGRRNIAWNKRLLLQLARAEMIELLDIQQPPSRRGEPDTDRWSREASARESARRSAPGATEAGEWDSDEDVAGLEDADSQRPEVATLRLNFSPRGTEVEQRIREMRDSEIAALRDGYEQMLAYAARERCIGRLLQRLYGPETAWACGGCPDCRRRGRQAPSPLLPLPRATPTHPQRTVIGDVPSPVRGDAERRRFEMLVRRLSGAGVRRFLSPEDGRAAVLAAVARAGDTLYRVDVWQPDVEQPCGPDEQLAVVHLGVLDQAALRLSAGSHVYHLLTSGTPQLDAEGRRPLERDGVPFYPTPDFWNP